MRTHQLAAWSIAAVIGLLAACEFEGGGPASDASHESDTVTLAAEPTLQLGVSEGDPAQVFGQVAGVALDSRGRIYVADIQADEVRVFSPEGTYLFAIGGTGEGPGDLSQPCCLSFDQTGRLWVRDAGNARYNAYEVEATGARYVTQVRMTHSDVFYQAPLLFGATGGLIDVGHQWDPSTGGMALHRIEMDSAGDVRRAVQIPTPGQEELGIRSVERVMSDGSRRSVFVHPPYGPVHLVAHSPVGGWAAAVSSAYEVTWYDQEGEPVRTIERADASGPRISASEREAAQERVLAQAGSEGAIPRDAVFRVPERKPPLASLFFDQLGRLWVQRSVAEGEPNEADLYSSDGELLARAAWPPGIELTEGFMTEGTALGLGQDSVGTPIVVRLDLVDGP